MVILEGDSHKQVCKLPEKNEIYDDTNMRMLKKSL